MRCIFLLLFLLPHVVHGNPADSIVNKELVLVNIANLSRVEIAQLISEIECRNPKVIGIDAWFTHPKEGDSTILRTLYAYKNIVLGVKLTECSNGKCDSLTGNYFPYIKEGHVMVRYKTLTYEPILIHKKKVYPFFCLALLQEYDSTIVRNFFTKRIFSHPLTYYGNYSAFITVEGKEFLTKEFSQSGEVKDKIVVLCYLGKRIGHVKKRKPVDYKRSYMSDGKLPDMYGAVMLANILTDIMNRAR